jgi:non-heme chloroperoxidase
MRTPARPVGELLRPLVVYEGASHGLPFTHRDRLNADLLAFIGPGARRGATGGA